MADELSINQFILTAADLAYTFEAPNGMHTGEHAQKNAKKAEQSAKRTIILMTHKAPTSAQPSSQFENDRPYPISAPAMPRSAATEAAKGTANDWQL